MYQHVKKLAFALIVILALYSTVIAFAKADDKPHYESTVYDLINAVNALRASYGLPAYSINSILMFTAQNQTDFMSANGVVVHTGPGGSTVTQRLLAAGYPLGGDLSLGGFRSENIIAINVNLSAEDAVSAWMGDAPHQYTMLSPDLTEIGGGVAVANGLVYYVIDCARPTTSGAPQASTPVLGSGATIPANAAAMIPVTLSTPDANGEVVHEVKSGQTLWQIAISYKVKIDDIKRLNNLAGNDIYPGNKLLIQKVAAPTVVPSSETATSESSATALPPVSLTPTLVVIATQTLMAHNQQNNGAVMTVAIGIVALAILGAWIFTWLGRSGNNTG